MISKVRALVIISMRFVKHFVKICTEDKMRIECQNCFFHLEKLLVIEDCPAVNLNCPSSPSTPLLNSGGSRP